MADKSIALDGNIFDCKDEFAWIAVFNEFVYQMTGAIDSFYIVKNDRVTLTTSKTSSAIGNFVFLPPFFDYSKSFGGQLCNNYPCIKSV